MEGGKQEAQKRQIHIQVIAARRQQAPHIISPDSTLGRKSEALRLSFRDPGSCLLPRVQRKGPGAQCVTSNPTSFDQGHPQREPGPG